VAASQAPRPTGRFTQHPAVTTLPTAGLACQATTAGQIINGMRQCLQFSVTGMLAMPVFIGAGLWSLLFIGRLDPPQWWHFAALCTCAGACFGAAIGAPARQLRMFATYGAGLLLLLSVCMLVIGKLL
jgi:hypothetical protein